MNGLKIQGILPIMLLCLCCSATKPRPKQLPQSWSIRRPKQALSRLSRKLSSCKMLYKLHGMKQCTFSACTFHTVMLAVPFSHLHSDNATIKPCYSESRLKGTEEVSIGPFCCNLCTFLSLKNHLKLTSFLSFFISQETLGRDSI